MGALSLPLKASSDPSLLGDNPYLVFMGLGDSRYVFMGLGDSRYSLYEDWVTVSLYGDWVTVFMRTG